MARSIEFSHAVRTVSEVARLRGLRVPTFRSPPAGSAHRTIRRSPRGTPVVSVPVQGRPWHEVLQDLVDGVVAVNVLGAADVVRCRSALWDALHATAHAA